MGKQVLSRYQSQIEAHRAGSICRFGVLALWLQVGSSLNYMFPFRVLYIRVTYNFGELKREPNLDNYPNMQTVHTLRSTTYK